MFTISIVNIQKLLDSEKIEYKYIGKNDLEVNGFSSLKNYKEGNITWVKNNESIPKSIDINNLNLVVIQEDINVNFQNQIITNESKRAFFTIVEHFFTEPKETMAVGYNTYISPGVSLGENVQIGHNCVLDGNIEIADGTKIFNNVTLVNNIKIGKNCEVQSGTTIGHDGFGYVEHADNVKSMVKHFGGVKIGDNVHISGNCCIARGTIDDTVVEDGCKFDSNCFVAHNCIIGKNSALVAGTAILGSVTLGENAYIASATIKNQLNIGSNSLVGVGAVVLKDVKPNEVVAGVPAKVINYKE